MNYFTPARRVASKIFVAKNGERRLPANWDLIKIYNCAWPLTNAQKRQFMKYKDLEKPFPMSRLLGDTGSGKTVVAAAAPPNH